MRDRAYRRSKDRSIKTRRSKYYDGYGKDDPKIIGKLLHTPTVCSDPMCCGNPRKLGKLTIQELRALEGKDEDLD